MWRKVGATASTTIDGQPKEARKKKGNNQNKKDFSLFWASWESTIYLGYML
jgi:hypothetical protein